MEITIKFCGTDYDIEYSFDGEFYFIDEMKESDTGVIRNFNHWKEKAIYETLIEAHNDKQTDAHEYKGEQMFEESRGN